MKLKAVNRLRMDPEHSTLYRGHHVLIMNRRGLITSSDEGYYLHQTRFLSKFELFAEGVPLKAVCSVSVEPHSCVSYFLVPSPAGKAGGPPGDGDPSGGEVVDKGIEIQINTYTGGGVHQDVHIINHTLAHSTIALDWMFAADFADMDEITSGSRVQNGAVERLFKSKGAGTAELTFVYKHPRINHATRIMLMGPGSVAYEREALRTTLSLTPRAAELMTLDIAPVFLGKAMAPWFDIDGKPTCHNVNQILSEQWLAACIGFESSNSAVQAAWDRAAADLWSLQSLQGENEEVFTPMAGIPKYTALFGRDTLMASIQSAMLNPSTLKGSLVTVGRWTATSTEDHFDAQPGKVLHQRQLSPLALLGETPFLHYYGDYSGPGLYIIAAALHFGYTGDSQAFAAIRDNVCATLDWIDRDGDIDGDGFYEYRTLAGKAGIKNQGWKDSGQAILYADGSYVRDPIAVAEVQGLYFAAKQSIAGVFAALGEEAKAKDLLTQAAALKKRFNEKFWLPEENYFAIALDPDKKPVASIASNAGSCLAYGIIDDDKAQAVAERLVTPDMFSGWGVRTLSSGHPAYNPLAYHLGTIWPVSNGNICFGLKRYGFHEAFHKVAKAIFDATEIFDYDRLPEVYGGHPRSIRHPHPGIYPDSCSPQAWSASAIIQICHAMTGLLPLAFCNTLILDPALPDWMPQLTIRDFQIGDQRVSIRFHRDEKGLTQHEITGGGKDLLIYRPKIVENHPQGDRIALALKALLNK